LTWRQTLVVAIRVVAQEASDLSSRSGGLQLLALGTGVIEEVPLQPCRRHVPLHDQRRPQALQDTSLFRCQPYFAGPTGIQHGHHLVKIIGKLVVIVSKSLLVFGKHSEAPFVRLKFTHFVGSISVFGQFGILGRFLSILLRGEHG
jgi:hypothetical protein